MDDTEFETFGFRTEEKKENKGGGRKRGKSTEKEKSQEP